MSHAKLIEIWEGIVAENTRLVFDHESHGQKVYKLNV